MGDAQHGRFLLFSVGLVTAVAIYLALIAAKVIYWLVLLTASRSDQQTPGPGA